MSQTVFAVLIVVALLSANFTRLLFERLWPLVEHAIRRHLDAARRDGITREAVETLVQRIERLEDDHGRR
ncbi:MAG: hypothetical protein PHP86_06205 [Nevskiales bacterium]|nr:hypothetical protein [Nevskiales bacterium]